MKAIVYTIDYLDKEEMIYEDKESINSRLTKTP